MLQSFRPQGRCQHLDQGVVLAVAVVGQRPERTVSQRDQIGRCGVRDLAQVTDGRIEDTGYGSTAVIAAREDRVGERQKVPHQVQPLDRIAWGHRVDDGAALHVQIVDQDPSVLPSRQTRMPVRSSPAGCTAFATAAGLSAPASSSRRRRLAARSWHAGR